MKLVNYNLNQKEFDAISSRVGRVLTEGEVVDEFDIVFIRIQSLDRSNRIVLRQAINKNPSAFLILLSSNSLIAKFAWRVQAFHYLSYPINETQLGILRLKINKNFLHRNDSEKLKMTYKGGFHMLHPSAITVIEGKGNYCQFYFKNKAPELYTARIGSIYQKIIDFPYMKKVNRSLIININHLSQMKDGNAYFSGKPLVKLKLSERSVIAVKKELLWLE